MTAVSAEDLVDEFECFGVELSIDDDDIIEKCEFRIVQEFRHPFLLSVLCRYMHLLSHSAVALSFCCCCTLDSVSESWNS